MTRMNISLRSVLLAIVIAVVSAAPSAGAVGPPPGVLGPPSSTPGLPTIPPTPVCNPSWGSIVIPICV
jgi:hypothetical protein